MATLPALPHPHMTDREVHALSRPLVFALLFALVTYGLVSGRAVLDPDHPYPLWSGLRLLSVSTGALLFWVALRLIEGWKRGPIRELALRALALVLPASAAMLCARLLIDFVTLGELRPATNIRWVLVWMGYFAASLSAALAVHLYSRIELLSREEPEGTARESEPAAADDSLWVQRQGYALRVPVAAIEWVEAEGNYVRIHAGDASGLIRTPLSVMAVRLEATGFIRVHRSIVCRSAAIRAVKRRRSGAMLAELGSGTEVPVGRSYGDRIRALRVASTPA